MKMIGLSALFLALSTLPVLTTAVFAAGSPFCTGDRPECVLQCYAASYAGRDSTSYAALLAADYVRTDLSYPDQAPLDYKADLELTKRMFRAPSVRDLEIAFGSPGRVEPGEDPGIWLIRDIPSTLRIRGVSDTGRPGPWTVTKVVSFWVRLVPQPERHYVIFRQEMRDAAEK